MLVGRLTLCYLWLKTLKTNRWTLSLTYSQKSIHIPNTYNPKCHSFKRIQVKIHSCRSKNPWQKKSNFELLRFWISWLWKYWIYEGFKYRLKLIYKNEQYSISEWWSQWKSAQKNCLCTKKMWAKYSSVIRVCWRKIGK